MRGEDADRVPLNVFAGWNPGVRATVNEKYGHVDEFCRRHHIDMVTGVVPRFPFGRPEEFERIPDLGSYLEMDPIDPNSSSILDQRCDGDLFLTVSEALEYHKQDLGVFVHVWSVFEMSQFLFEKDGLPGTEEALINMVADREKTREMYFRLAEWAAACAENAIRAGADAIKLSDDWGQQNTMLFSPKLWREIIYPPTKIIVDTIKKHDVPILLHSDGDVSMVLDGIKELGVNGLHPVQESAGMSFDNTRQILGNKVCIMGGLDTVTALPVMNATAIREEVRRVFEELKHSGPFIFSGSHMFQDDAPLDVIEAAYEEAYELGGY